MTCEFFPNTGKTENFSNFVAKLQSISENDEPVLKWAACKILYTALSYKYEDFSNKLGTATSEKISSCVRSLELELAVKTESVEAAVSELQNWPLLSHHAKIDGSAVMFGHREVGYEKVLTFLNSFSGGPVPSKLE